MLDDDPTDNLDCFVHDMLLFSDFVYRFNNIRTVVRENDGTKVKPSFFSKPREIKFVEPELIITAGGSQEKDDFEQLKYDITGDAMLRFLQKNRKNLLENEDGDLFLDKEGKDNAPFRVEKHLEKLINDDVRIVDYNDRFSTSKGGLVYAVVVNITRKWVMVSFRGTVGITDLFTDADFSTSDSFFENEDDKLVPGGNPATHNGFTSYLMSSSKSDSVDRPYIQRILACVRNQFENNPDIKGKDFKLFVTGHSLGGGLSNLFSFRVAQLNAKGHESVKHLPDKVKALTFASPCVGNRDYQKEFQALEKQGLLRLIRVSNASDVIPTMNFYPPVSWICGTNASHYSQNGVNLHYHSDGTVDVGYLQTKTLWSQTSFKSPGCHSVNKYIKRVGDEGSHEIYKRSIEEIYEHELLGAEN
jgi:hypothetical protein